jgi:glycine/D-amino acid oxidase-like deaminating enzyme
MSGETTHPSYIIVGSGVFGTSTALHLIRKYPTAQIRLVDRNRFTAPTRAAASWDWNKVVRADYTDIFYTRLALEARELWRNDPLWKPFYHESGIYWAATGSFAAQVLKNFDELGVEAELASYSVDEAKNLFSDLFAQADYTGINEVLVNRVSGWANAKEALQAATQAAVELGVVYTEAEVTKLLFDNGRCVGVETRAGETFKADRVVICTGAYTAKLLADSSPDQPTMHVGKRMVAMGVTEAIASLDEDLFQKFGSMPVGITDVPTDQGVPIFTFCKIANPFTVFYFVANTMIDFTNLRYLPRRRKQRVSSPRYGPGVEILGAASLPQLRPS